MERLFLAVDAALSHEYAIGPELKAQLVQIDRLRDGMVCLYFQADLFEIQSCMTGHGNDQRPLILPE
jgi:hypothetical protein